MIWYIFDDVLLVFTMKKLQRKAQNNSRLAVALWEVFIGKVEASVV